MKNKKKKLVFRKGIHTIIFPIYAPVGLIDFDKHARSEIQKIANSYEKRKGLTWEYQATYPRRFADVKVTKLK